MVTVWQKLAIKIPLVESVYTVQGEGAFQGHAAYFIRLGGCDVGCTWCDTKHSWVATDHPLVSVEQIARQVATSGSSIAVVTGGEPTLYNLSLLTKYLKQERIRTHIETSGVYPLTGEWDWICFSPKKFKVPLSSVYTRADELKIVICNKSDLEWAEQHATKVKKDCALFLQPEWLQKDKIIPIILEYIKTRPQWKISIQIHKHIHIQ